MKNIIISIILILIASALSSVCAQDPPAPPAVPTAPTAPDLRNDDIRRRSIEMERAKRDAAKTNTESVAVNSDIDAKFPEIKEDFEGIQLSQSAIVKAYTTGEKIDYKAIQSSADAINKHANRLNLNLFEEGPKEKKDESKETKAELKSVKDLIVELDNSIMAFTTSKMFQNLREVDSETAVQTQSDLFDIMKASAELSSVAKRMN